VNDITDPAALLAMIVHYYPPGVPGIEVFFRVVDVGPAETLIDLIPQHEDLTELTDWVNSYIEESGDVFDGAKIKMVQFVIFERTDQGPLKPIFTYEVTPVRTSPFVSYPILPN